MKKINKTLIILILTIILSIYSLPSLAIEDNINNNELTKNYNSKKVITFDKTIGVNGFIDDSVEILSVAGTVREYHNFSWTLDKANENKFNPSYVSSWYFDSYYKNLYEAGITVMPCIQGTSKAAVSDMTSRNQKPITSNEDSLDPLSYSEHASTMFQYAARYGNKKVSEDKLLLADGQPKVSGLGYIEYYENWNEPDKTWEGEKCYFSPEEFAAMCSADYDGHEKRLGDTYGIKNADENAKLVMGGVCNNSNLVNYLNGMKAWAEENRTDKQIPIDVINFHMYVGKNSPENSNFEERCKEIVAWRDENAPDKEIWLTEFGWDTNEKSALGANQEHQRDWLMRTYLMASALGIDRSTMYMIRDAGNSTDTGKYSTSGLTTKKGEWNKKASWYGVYTLKNTLEGYVFKEIVREDNELYAYKFEKEDTGEVCYAIWSPTEDGSKINNCMLKVGDYQKATLTTLKDKSTQGEITNLQISNNNEVVVNVTETPIFVKLSDKKKESKPLTFNIKLNADKTTLYSQDKVTIIANISEINKNDSNGLIALSGKLEYDKNVLELDLDSIKGLGDWNFSKSDFNENNFKFVTDSDSSIENKGEIFKLTFNVKKDAKLGETKIKLSSIMGATGEKENGIINTSDAIISLNIEKKEDYIWGDNDGDGEVTVNDLARIKLHCIGLLKLTGTDFKASDVDNDNEITVNDLAIIKLKLINLI